MKSLLSRIRSCTGRFVIDPQTPSGTVPQRQLYFKDHRAAVPVRPIQFATTKLDGHITQSQLTYAQVFALYLSTNGYTLMSDDNDPVADVDGWYLVDGRYYGAAHIELRGKTVAWTSCRDSGDYHELTYTLPDSLDDVITADGNVIDTGAFVVLLALTAKFRTPLFLKEENASLEGFPMPFMRFRADSVDPYIHFECASLLRDGARLLPTWSDVSGDISATFCGYLNALFVEPGSRLGDADYDVWATKFMGVAQSGLPVGWTVHSAPDPRDLTYSFSYRIEPGEIDSRYSPYDEQLDYVVTSVDGISGGVLALQDTLADVQGSVGSVGTAVDGVSQQVSGLSGDVALAKDAIITAIGDVSIDLSPVEAQIERVFSQASVDSQIVAAMAIKIAIGKLPKKLRLTLLNALRGMRYDQGALPDYAGQHGGAVSLYDMLFDSNGKPTFTQEAPDGSDTQH